MNADVMKTCVQLQIIMNNNTRDSVLLAIHMGEMVVVGTKEVLAVAVGAKSLH